MDSVRFHLLCFSTICFHLFFLPSFVFKSLFIASYCVSFSLLLLFLLSFKLIRANNIYCELYQIMCHSITQFGEMSLSPRRWHKSFWLGWIEYWGMKKKKKKTKEGNFHNINLSSYALTPTDYWTNIEKKRGKKNLIHMYMTISRYVCMYLHLEVKIGIHEEIQ